MEAGSGGHPNSPQTEAPSRAPRKISRWAASMLCFLSDDYRTRTAGLPVLCYCLPRVVGLFFCFPRTHTHTRTQAQKQCGASSKSGPAIHLLLLGRSARMQGNEQYLQQEVEEAEDLARQPLIGPELRIYRVRIAPTSSHDFRGHCWHLFRHWTSFVYCCLFQNLHSAQLEVKNSSSHFPNFTDEGEFSGGLLSRDLRRKAPRLCVVL